MEKCFLSIETSLERIFLVLYGKEKLYSISKNLDRSIEIEINTMFENILAQANLRFADLNYILVSLGPGSYTGTRVGLAAAKAISVSINKPILGYTNFEAIYNQALIEGLIEKKKTSGIIIKANKNDCYYQEIDNNFYLDTKVLNLDNIQKAVRKKSLTVGNYSKLSVLEDYHYCLPKKESILNIYFSKMKSTHSIKEKELEPLYIRGHYADK